MFELLSWQRHWEINSWLGLFKCIGVQIPTAIIKQQITIKHIQVKYTRIVIHGKSIQIHFKMILIQFKWVSTYQRISTSEERGCWSGWQSRRKLFLNISKHYLKTLFKRDSWNIFQCVSSVACIQQKRPPCPPRGTAATLVADWCLPAVGAITSAEIITASVIRRLDMSFWTPREDEGVRGHDEVDSWHLIPSTHYLIWYKCNNNNPPTGLSTIMTQLWLNTDTSSLSHKQSDRRHSGFPGSICGIFLLFSHFNHCEIESLPLYTTAMQLWIHSTSGEDVWGHRLLFVKSLKKPKL